MLRELNEESGSLKYCFKSRAAPPPHWFSDVEPTTQKIVNWFGQFVELNCGGMLFASLGLEMVIRTTSSTE